MENDIDLKIELQKQADEFRKQKLLTILKLFNNADGKKFIDNEIDLLTRLNLTTTDHDKIFFTNGKIAFLYQVKDIINNAEELENELFSK